MRNKEYRELGERLEGYKQDKIDENRYEIVKKENRLEMVGVIKYSSELGRYVYNSYEDEEYTEEDLEEISKYVREINNGI